ncbi:hypothetical protein [Christiangramia forsetii]|uniref:Secreted protein n=2 Tax=Christiangramia forsetii TaxID=411153 RepID=A0M6Z8_CHRFK|nr:hypothetical protein [Christiangramia forsetii]GGG29085.1 hypothetical protein GCM10011532_10700 [Christiangramia forsetii]CAL68393.1 secreted protein [Christiangramia forsetii KT0803]
MKLFYLASFLFFLLIQTGCSSGNIDDKSLYTGIIQSTDITSYQYGTHSLETEDDFYALKSNTIDLNKYVDQKVKIEATQIQGYPVDGGPIYLLVTKVNK